MIDTDVVELVDCAKDGRTLNKEEALHLMGFGQDSPEAAYIRWAAEEMGRAASDNVGQIYAQIGVDQSACPCNCEFCSLAACNTSQIESAVVPTETVVAYARVFDEAGVHLISLMATAALPFDEYLRIASAVRDAVGPDMPLMANIGDVTLEQVRRLKDAGFQAAYHANRLQEGVITGLRPETRVATMCAIQEAGLKLMTAVEPVGSQSDLRDIAEHMAEVASFEPYCAGVGRLTAVPGTLHADEKPVSNRRLRQLASILRLMAGSRIEYGCGAGNVVWTDAGTNPRGRDLSTDPAFLRRDVARLRKELTRDGWTVPKRPLPYWL